MVFYSKSLSSMERNYEIHNKEMLAIIYALEEWRHFLEEATYPVEIWTDHKNLEYFMTACQGQNLEERKWKIIGRNYTPFRSNVQRRRSMYLAMIERRLRWRVKDIGAESDLLNDLGFNLCVAPRSPVVRLVAYFGVREVAKTGVLRSRSGQGEIRTRWL